MFSSVALTALALALAAQPVSSGVKWVPLKSVEPAKLKPVEEPTSVAPPAQPATVPRAAPEPAPAPTEVARPAAPGVQGRLDLTCMGAGTANKPKTAFVNSYGHVSGSVGMTSYSGTGHGTTTIYGMRQQGFSDQVDVRLFGGDDRIRMPRTMLPPIRGGKDGWFKLKNVVADARSIRAKAAVNLLNNPNVFIDRVTGTISISGKAGDYSGQCQVIDSTAAPKF
jgi:hypothetical protein